MSQGPPEGQPPTNDVVFPSLKASIQAGRCVAVIGAGMSVPDYPLWPGLVDQLRERCGVRSEDVRSDDLLDVTQAAQDRDPAAYFAALDEIFDRRSPSRAAHRYHLLARIGFSSYVSLNLDPLLVDTLDLHDNIFVSDYPNLQVQSHGARELFCVHGRISPGRPAASTPMVLTRKEFEAAYNPFTPPLHSFIQQMLLGNDLCFLGCNPTEAHLAHIVKACAGYNQERHGVTSEHRPNWYLLADEGYSESDALKGTGINLVRFNKQDARYTGLDDILVYLAGKKPPHIRPAGVQRSRFNADVEPDR